MSQQCYLCGNKARQTGLSLHGFPKDNAICDIWRQVCNLRKDDDVSHLRICGNHFTDHEFQNLNVLQYGGKLRLKYGAAPSLSVPHPLMQQSVVSCLPSTSALVLHQEMLEPSTSKIVPDVPVASVSETAGVLDRALEQPQNDEELLNVSECFQQESTGMEPQDFHTPRKRKFFSPRFVGEIHETDVTTPKRAKRTLFVAKAAVKKYTSQIKALRARNRRLVKKVTSVQALLLHLQEKNLMSEQAGNILLDTIPENIKELLARKLQSKSKRKYSADLRSFALTLQFYSAKAYNYVRSTWDNLLPHPSTIRRWYTVVNGTPGFTQEAFHAISLHKDKNYIINIVIDEMSIRQQVIYDNNRFYGGVDFGTQIETNSDGIHEARSALVFMAVAVNGGWKVPLGYFLIQTLTGSERANLLIKCIELLHETNVRVVSITFDGAPVNITMCVSLGANFTYDGNFKPWFEHPVTNEKIFIFWDACHMIKLVRNTLGDKKILRDSNNDIIDWTYLKELATLESEKGLRAATKLSKRHINYNDNRMSVKLAVQTLSESVYNALRLVNQLHMHNFENCLATANFCYIFNNIFDLLNCRNKFSRKNKFNIPLSETSYTFLKDNADVFINYILHLKDNTGTPILKSNRKTGFLGLIVCMINIFELYNAIKSTEDYLLTFKLSQDFLETFFSAIRSRGGFNNNPNAKQFESAYKRLLIRHELKAFDSSNCLSDGIEILHYTAKKQTFCDVVTNDTCDISTFDHDYINTMWSLDPFLDNIVTYIGGYISGKLAKLNMCAVCVKHLMCKDTPGLLIQLKNRGSLLSPSKDVCKICQIAETVFRQHIHEIFTKKHIKEYLLNKIFYHTSAMFSTVEMNNHVLGQDALDNHRIQLIKTIIETFLKIRLHHEARIRSVKDSNIRQKYTKLILFKNQ